MTLVTQINGLITRIGTEFKALRIVTGALTGLTTADKTSLVAAVNEVKASVAGAAGISDGSTGAGSTWSSTKINNEILAAKSSILGTASSAYDTLQEIQALMIADDTETTGILTSLGNRLRIDAAQALTAPQQAFGRDNLNVYSRVEMGDPNTDFVAAFNAALL
jgi:hypothetical protein